MTQTGKIDRDLSRLKVLNKVSRIGYILFHYALLSLLSFVLLYPLFYMFSMAFRPPKQLLDPTIIWISRSLTLQNIRSAWEKINFLKALNSTFITSIVSSLLSVISCSLTGYGFARFNFRGKSVLFALVLFTIIVPPQTTTIPSYLSYRFFDFFGLGNITALFSGTRLTANLLDTYWVYFIPAAFANGIRAGLFIYIFRQFFRGLPKELEDAAYIDGCGIIQTFIRVVIPCSGNAFLTVFLFSLIWYWNDYYFSSLMFSNSGTLPVMLAGLKDSFSNIAELTKMSNPYEVFAILQAGCLLMLFPILLLFLILQRYFVQSIERTGIVG